MRPCCTNRPGAIRARRKAARVALQHGKNNSAGYFFFHIFHRVGKGFSFLQTPFFTRVPHRNRHRHANKRRRRLAGRTPTLATHRGHSRRGPDNHRSCCCARQLCRKLCPWRRLEHSCGRREFDTDASPPVHRRRGTLLLNSSARAIRWPTAGGPRPPKKPLRERQRRRRMLSEPRGTRRPRR